MPVLRYKWHPYTRRHNYFMAVCGVALGIAGWLATGEERNWAPRILVCVFVLFCLLLLVDHETRIDVAASLVISEGRLFGRYLVWRRQAWVSDFTTVGFRRHRHSDGNDTVFVGLRRRSGRLMAVQYFSVGAGYPCDEAERAARNLAEATGLEIHQAAHSAP